MQLKPEVNQHKGGCLKYSQDVNHWHFAPLRRAVACGRMQLKDAHAGIDYIGGKRGTMLLSSLNNANVTDDATTFASNCS